MVEAWKLASSIWPDYSASSSRRDFTLPQLFACLVVGVMLKLSYRKTEKLLRDSPQWLADIGMSKTPDHNTLWRASGVLMRLGPFNRMMDHLARHFDQRHRLRLSDKPLALDSTCFEDHHRSDHYDRRCRRIAQQQGKNSAKTPGKTPGKPGKWGASVNASRSRRLRAMPKLAVAVASSCHLILAAKMRLGNGSDAPDFDGLLFDSWKRAPVKVVVADAGYDSEANHCIARQEMSVRSIIPPGIGRPTSKLPSGRWRRHMAKRFARKADQKTYAQRNQSETVHSMLKRNEGSALRSRKPERRKQEMMLRVLTHNIMLLAKEKEG
jgi:hypothetical protein